jgi:hypothetical protein
MIPLLRFLAIFSVLLLPSLSRAVPIEQYDTMGSKALAPAFDAAEKATPNGPLRLELMPWKAAP